jgi:hypothetical protein
MLAGIRAVCHQRQSGDSFVRAYQEHIRQLDDATIIDNP